MGKDKGYCYSDIATAYRMGKDFAQLHIQKKATLQKIYWTEIMK